MGPNSANSGRCQPWALHGREAPERDTGSTSATCPDPHRRREGSQVRRYKGGDVRPHRTLWALLAAASMCLAAACGSTSHNADGPKPTAPPPVPSPASNSTTTTTPPPDHGQDPAILAAYQGELGDFNAVATHAPVQGNSAVLADHASGRELKFVTSQLLSLQAAGQVDVGSLTSLHARVTQYNGSQAVVESCQRDTVQIVATATGRIVKPAGPSTELVNDLLVPENGAWKVEFGSNVSPGCT